MLSFFKSKEMVVKGGFKKDIMRSFHKFYHLLIIIGKFLVTKKTFEDH